MQIFVRLCDFIIVVIYGGVLEKVIDIDARRGRERDSGYNERRCIYNGSRFYGELMSVMNS